jgi:hypothetical protein
MIDIFLYGLCKPNVTPEAAIKFALESQHWFWALVL